MHDASTGDRDRQSAILVTAVIEPIILGDREIAPGRPTFVIAELSANHGGSLDRAVALVRAAAAAGADAVKLQTYTADTMTIVADGPQFTVGDDMVWKGRSLHDLYAEASTPWEWYDALREVADEERIVLFSSPFDPSAVDFLQEHGAPLYKIASFELVDIPLIEHVASKRQPMIMSTGMATADEIDEAVSAARRGGAPSIALLRCNSAYPAPAAEMDLRTIPDMMHRWGLPVGLSDHTLGMASAVASVALGSCLLEKHLTLARSDGGPDATFSLEPDELRATIAMLREAEAALGSVRYGPTEREQPSTAFRRSLYVVADIELGAPLSAANVRSIRPAGGLAPKHLPEVLGRTAARMLRAGTPLTWDDLDITGIRRI